MKKSLVSVVAVMFTFAVGAVFAAAHTKEAPKADPVAAACKDKKAGTEVTVDGKKVKCPEAKKEAAPAAAPAPAPAPAKK
jgi:hypothetical protein